MSNALITSAQGLTLAEKRVMAFAVAQLDSCKPNGGWPSGIIKLQAHDYAAEFGVDPDTAYDQLQSAAAKLYERDIVWSEKVARGMKKVRIRWVSRAEYAPGMGYVALRFTQDVAPHLVGLRDKFTSYKLQQAAALRSIYSWRLLEMLSQFKGTGWMQIGIDEFCHAMDATEKQRANFNNIKRRIVEPAVKELTEKDGWLITWTPIKEGRKVSALRFEFKRDPQGRLAL